MESLLYVFQWVHRKASPCAQVDLAGNIPVIAKIPARCGQCQKKVPAVSSLALWCAGCFSPEELQLQLCRTCHPSTRDLLDKALPSYEAHCAQNFELLSNMTPITGDEPALRLSPLHGGYQDPPGALNMPSTLPSYSVRPEYMPADTHCALCFHVCPMPSPPLESRPEHRGVHPAVVAHVRSIMDCSMLTLIAELCLQGSKWSGPCRCLPKYSACLWIATWTGCGMTTTLLLFVLAVLVSNFPKI